MTNPRDLDDLLARIDQLTTERVPEQAAAVTEYPQPVGFDEPQPNGWLARAIARITR